MIRYALKCAHDHAFESWFQSADAFESLLAAGHLACPECGSADVTKALMAPRVQADRKVRLSAPETPDETALAELRRRIEQNSDYVGSNFAAEARRMHDGEVAGRSIYGEAKLTEAKALIDDGIPVAPLPFVPARRAN